VLDNQGMEFVEKTLTFREPLHEEFLKRVIGLIRGREAQAGKKPPRVGVDNKERPSGGIQKDAVRGFGSDAVYGKQFPPQVGCLFLQ
jgi:hypothetical protein